MSDNSGEDRRSSGSAEEVYAEYRRRIEAGETLELDALCEAHPALADGLRLIHACFPETVEGDLDSFERRIESLLNRGLSGAIAAGGEGPEGGSLPPASKPWYTADGPRRFRVLSTLASGGMGVVLRVYDEDLDRNLALKVLRAGPDRAGAPADEPGLQDRRRRFLREARILARLDHPGILPVHVLGFDPEGELFFTMPIVRGDTLAAVFRLAREGRAGWSLVRALQVLLQVARTLAYVHKQGVIHRDLKPANVMVGSYGEAYVMDWGLAKALRGPDADRENAPPPPAAPEGERGPEPPAVSSPALEPSEAPTPTLEGTILGTPSYIAPEQAAGRLDAVDERSDVYAFGAMLYELLTGQAPYTLPGESASSREILRRLERGPPQPPGELHAAAPAELVSICEKAMARRRQQRYQSMDALAEDLQAYVEGRVVQAHRTGAVAELSKWVGRNRAVAAAACVTILVLVAALVATAFIESRARRVETEAKNQALAARDAEAEARRDVLRLSDANKLLELVEQVDFYEFTALKNHDQMERWLADTSSLASRLPEHKAALERLRGRGWHVEITEVSQFPLYHPWTKLDALADSELQVLTRELFLLETRLTSLQNPATRENPLVLQARRDTLAARIKCTRDRRDLLRGPIFKEGRWFFRDQRDQWHHDALAGLVYQLEFLKLRSPVLGLHRLVEDMQRIARISLVESEEKWSEAIRSTADENQCPQYYGLKLPVQAGLVPLGRDPESGLWEFGDLRSGALPARGEDGRLEITEETGLVFVLIPPDGPPRPRRANHRQPGRIRPFLLSKFEMTQGQWLRLAGDNPSHLGPAVKVAGRSLGLLHPVEGTSSQDVRELFRRFEYACPSAEQWEHAARAGTTGPWPSGAEKESLQGHANLADAACQRLGGFGLAAYEEWLDDGHLFHAPVGSFAPNRFGLHDMIGNVWELCSGPALSMDSSLPAGSPMPRYGEPPLGDVPIRGGSFMETAARARTDFKEGYPSHGRAASIGVRPSIRIR